MSSLPKVQRSVQINSHGGIEVVKVVTDAPVLNPADNEVLVKNAYAGLNFIDTYFRSGLYPVSSFPYTLGREAEGTIAAVGSSVRNFKVGDKVAYLGVGAQQEYTTLDPLHVAHVPSAIPEGVAAASLLQGLTALTLARESYEIKKGDYILIHAAAGGFGLWLLQIAKVIGAHVIATASSEQKLALAKEHGAEFLINYSTQNWIAEVKKITKDVGGGVAAVFDGVGKDTFDGDLEVVKRKGTVVSLGNASGAVPPLTLTRLSPKNIKLLRPALSAYIAERGEFETYTKEIFDWIIEGKIKVNIHKIYPLKDVAQAQKDLESRGTTGKLVLKI
ncbi:NAD(P)-binding protein [Choiromyces venosus 120613-1]|uniref:Probable quinone oxidoreductase n=1 Tax=Choiromyces venosus 120613-1 TaxID=1336337 RepID=A0A3N4K603_9PEZI|nr:NAD(P)-binding protein [Choiromyces venosus 120613-1]